MSSHRDGHDLMDAEAFSVQELRRMVFEKQGPLAAPLALSLLGRKRYEDQEQDFERLLMDEAAAPRLRNMAALELGRLGSPGAIDALERGLGIAEGLSVRGVLEGLSLTGVDHIPAAIDRLTERADPVGETARRIALLLRHRLGLLDTAPTQPESAIEIGTPSADEVEETLAALAKTVPGLELAKDGAVSLRCERQSFLFLMSAENGARPEPSGLLQRAAQIGVVTARGQSEFSRWALRYYVLTEPLAGGETRIVLSTAKGAIMFEGTATIDGERTAFQVRSVEGTGALAISIEGVYDGSKIALTSARSGPRRQVSLPPSPLPR